MASPNVPLCTTTEQPIRLALLRFSDELENDRLYVLTAALAVTGLNEDGERSDDERGVLQLLDMLGRRLHDRRQQIDAIRGTEAGA